jgi:fructose-1,6-bisphosphatase II
MQASPARAQQTILEQELSLQMLGVVEQAAIASAKTMGQGNAKLSDQAAVESMRAEMDRVPLRGTIVIGEGERDEAPMLFIGEQVGGGGEGAPAVDIAVDPLEGTNLCATGAPGSITVLAASEHGGLLHAPDCYMEKIIVGPSCRGAVDLDAPVKDNLAAIARRLERRTDELVVVVLDRPRHQKLMQDIRATGARIHLIQDGDLSAGIATAVLGTGVHAVMGSGGAPEGVLTAAALRCLHGEIVARLVVDRPEVAERVAKMGIRDPKRVYRTEDLAPGQSILFAACGVTEGSLLQGVRFFGDGVRTQSLVMAGAMNKVRFVDTIHVAPRPDARVRFR